MSEITRTEKFLRACIDGEPCALKPLTRVEKLLAELNDKLAGGPSEVVILPETVLTVANIDEEGGVYQLNTPPENVPADGGVCEIMWGGEKYNSPAMDASSAMGAPAGTVFVLGNTDTFGMTEALGGNPAPDLPFLLMLFPNGQPPEQDGPIVYVNMVSLGITPEPPVLSIVQVGAASGGESAGGGYLYFTGTATMNSNTNNGEATLDKSFDQVLAAIKGKQPVFCMLSGVQDGTIYILQAVSSWNDVIVSLSGTMTGTSVELTMTRDGTNSVILR